MAEIILITGPAGSGKSALADHLKNSHLRNRQSVVVLDGIDGRQAGEAMLYAKAVKVVIVVTSDPSAIAAVNYTQRIEVSRPRRPAAALPPRSSEPASDASPCN